jgi:hypothetical protein
MDIIKVTGIGYSIVLFLVLSLFFRFNKIPVLIILIVSIFFYFSFIKGKLKSFFGYSFMLIGFSMLCFFTITFYSTHFYLSNSLGFLKFIYIFFILLISLLLILAGILILKYEDNFVERWIKNKIKTG